MVGIKKVLSLMKKPRPLVRDEVERFSPEALTLRFGLVFAGD
jgi:hypothetical protein